MIRNMEALLLFLEQRASMRFAWRSPRDCVSFANGAARAQTGRDLLAGLRWKSRREALAILEDMGGLEPALDARLQRIAPAMAKRGDVAGVSDELFGLRLMVVEGSTLVGPGRLGLKRMPRSAMLAAWSLDFGEGEG